MNRQQFLTHLNVEVQTLEFWLDQEWLVPARTGAEPTFADIDLARGRLIQDLTTRLGVNDEGVDVVLHLLDQLHGMRRAFEAMRDGLDARS